MTTLFHPSSFDVHELLFFQHVVTKTVPPDSEPVLKFGAFPPFDIHPGTPSERILTEFCKSFHTPSGLPARVHCHRFKV